MVAVVAGFALLGAACAKKTTTTTTIGNLPSTRNIIPDTNTSNVNSAAPLSFTFSDPTKSPHYVSNAPAHGAVLAGAPINVVIDFNFDLAAPSSMAITKDGIEYGTGSTTIDSSKLALRRAVDPTVPDGLYTSKYKACWPDGSCHDGQFQFAIDRSRVEAATDFRSIDAVTVRLKNIAFAPTDIRITRGATVTWVNDDNVEHYVNTDSHPGHTYELGQNSSALKTGQSFSYTFAKPGVYPYHCSAHAGTMAGTVIVE